MRRWGLPDKVDDPEIIKKISRAISDSETVLAIDEDNKGRLLGSLDDAVDSKITFAVKPKPLIFVLDIDDGGKVESLTAYVKQIKELGYDPIVSESGTPGHRHLICKTKSSEEYEELEKIAQLVDLSAAIRKNFIRPPGTPHRRGLPVRVVSHDRAIDILKALGSVSCNDNIPQSLRDKITDAIGIGFIYKSGSELTQSIVNQSHSIGLTLEETYELLRNPNNKGGAALRSRIKSKGSAAALRWLERSFEKAHKYGGQSRNVLRDIIKIESSIISRKCSGKSGLTDRDVSLAHLMIARKAGSLRYKTSIRAIANIANIGSLLTVRKSHERLQKINFLRKHGASRQGIPTSWEIICNEDDTINTIGGCDTNVSFARHGSSEAFAWSLGGVRGLGKAGVPVMDILAAEGPLGASTVAKETGLSRQTVYRALRRLADLGMVRQEGASWSILREEADKIIEEYSIASGISEAKIELKMAREEESKSYRSRIFSRWGKGRSWRIKLSRVG